MRLDWDEYQALVKLGRRYEWSVGAALKSSDAGTELQYYYLFSGHGPRFHCRNAAEVRMFLEGASRERKRIGIFAR